jgi:hypothetical protein
VHHLQSQRSNPFRFAVSRSLRKAPNVAAARDVIERVGKRPIAIFEQAIEQNSCLEDVRQAGVFAPAGLEFFGRHDTRVPERQNGTR